nr:sulfite exporter TauE/SafE family protein [Bdellovibrionales bacterium]
MSDIWFLLLGVAVGGFGTLIGAGGGFLLAPAFIFLFPDMKPAHLTALTLLAVFVNAASGSIIYAKRQTVHWPSVAWFTAAGVPGALLGAWLSHWVPRESYESAFVAFLIAMSAFVFWRSIKAKKNASARYWSGRTKWLGTAASFLIAVLASLLGIGGGVLHVPILAEFFRYPVHLGRGTSHAILAISGLAAVV